MSALSAASHAVLAAAVARLIPSDETGPGATEACVVRYIERSLVGPLRAQLPSYDRGLAALDADARTMFGCGFAALATEHQDRVLTQAELGIGSEPSNERSEFFELLRTHAIEGMFGDPRHAGNAGLVGWRLIGYRGPRQVIAPVEQRLESPTGIQSVDNVAVCRGARKRQR